VGRISYIERSFATPGTAAYLSHFWRESRTLVDAIRRWAAENPAVPGGAAPKGALEATSLLMRDALKKKRVADAEQERAGKTLPSDVPMTELFPGLKETLARTNDPFEALLESSPQDSPARRWAESFREQFRATSSAVGLTNLADRLAIGSTRPTRALIAARLITSLGENSDDYPSALRNLDAIEAEARIRNEANPLPLEEVLLLHEAAITLRPLVLLFSDPRRFFAEVLPLALPNEIHCSTKAVVGRWGWGALLNPTIRSAFDSEAAKPGFALTLAALEKREAFRSSGGAPRGRRPDVKDYVALAAEYYRLPRSERKEWMQREANRPPIISVSSLTRLLSKHRPR
jgi:hypothetical protein